MSNVTLLRPTNLAAVESQAPRYFHMAGDVFDNHAKVVPFETIPTLIGDWSRCALAEEAVGHGRLARVYAHDAVNLEAAYRRACQWRRASGGIPTLRQRTIL